MAKKLSNAKNVGGRKIAKNSSKNVGGRKIEEKSKFSHKSFRRSYREDYVRELNVPGASQHVFQTFRWILASWKIFLPLLLIVVVVAAGLLGVLDFSDYKDAGTIVVVGLIFLILWLVTIFVIRHKMAGQKVGLRDALYNAMTPLLSSFVVLALAVIQAVPVMILIIAYSSAVETHFLDMPFYAFLFLAFAGLMILITAYLWSGTLMALTAVTAPGLYPYEAIKTANELMVGRRIKFVLRLIVLFVVLLVIAGVTIIPMAVWLPENPATKIVFLGVGCFMVEFMAVYLYLYYRWMIELDA